MPPKNITHNLFFGNYFCLMKNYQAAFVAISKNAVTTLKNTVIHSEGLPIPGSDIETHYHIGYSPEKGYLVPVTEMEEYEREYGRLLKFAVWRDPVDRLISTYKWFILEKTQRSYFMCLNLYRDNSFDRFMEFVRFELGKKDALMQDEHIRKQSDYYAPGDVDFIVPLSQLPHFLQAHDIPTLRNLYNKSAPVDTAFADPFREQIKKLYEADYALPESGKRWNRK